MKNNKGFSIVELVIVISIMAVLIGLIAPQYFKYVKKSRRSVDIQNAGELIEGYKATMVGNPDVNFTSDTASFIPNCNAVGWTEATLEAFRTSATTDTVLYYMVESTAEMPDPKSINGASWYFVYNNTTNNPEKLYIVTDGSIFYEVWPDADEYYQTGNGKTPYEIQASY